MNSSIDFNKLCMGCMSVLDNADTPCPVCGFDIHEYSAPPHQLKPFTILNGKYLIGKVLGEGGFGITYLGWDLNLDIKIAVKEYYPGGLVIRENTGTSGSQSVAPYTGDKRDSFRYGLEKFLDEAKSLAKFYTLPGIVSVKDFFNENGTAYIVMEYIDGVTLKEHLANQGGKLNPDEVFSLMRPLMKSLDQVHKAGIIHRDISPDNIMLTASGEVKLLDFGAARGYGDDNVSRSVLLKPGYAPAEQYRTRGHQGPWTDVYALCATMYRMMTGTPPPESLERTENDELVPPSGMGIRLSREMEAALLKGMAVYEKDRYRSIDELMGDLFHLPKPEFQPVYHTEPRPVEKNIERPTGDYVKTMPLSLQTDSTDEKPQKREVFSQKPPEAEEISASSKRGWGAAVLDLLIRIVLLGAAFSLMFTEDFYNADLHYPTVFLLSVNLLYVLIDFVLRVTGEKKERILPNAIYACFQCAVVFLVTVIYIVGRGPEAGFDFFMKPILDIGYGFGLIVGVNTAYLISAAISVFLIFLEGKKITTSDTGLIKKRRAALIVSAVLLVLTTGFFLLTYNFVVKAAVRLDENGYSENYGTSETGDTKGTSDAPVTPPVSDATDAQPADSIDPAAEAIPWSDAGLESLIRELLDKPAGDITLSDIEGIEDIFILGDSIGEYTFDETPDANKVSLILTAEGSNVVKDLSSLQYFPNLKDLRIEYNNGLDLSSLTALSQVERLSLELNEITDLSPLSEMVWLKELYLNDPGLSDLSPLSGLTELTVLAVGGTNASANPLTDLSPLAPLINLKRLYLTGNGISDLTPLSGLENLEDLGLVNNNVQDVSPLSALPNLKNLYIFGNPVTDFSPLQSQVDGGLSITQ